MTKPIVLQVWRDGLTGELQVSIGEKDGGGFRLLGLRFNGTGGLLASRTLDGRDADELERYAKKIRQGIKMEATT